MFLFLALLCADPPRPAITGAAHYAVFVKDVAQSRAFYKDFLGYNEPFDLKNNDGSLSLTFIRINSRQYVELFPEKAPGGDRLNHLSIETADAEALRLYLKAKGVTVPDKVGRNRIGNLSFNVKDPDGHTLEITQYLPGGMSFKDKAVSPVRISDRMAHFGIIVGSLSASMKFYGDILGFKETWRGSRDGKRLDWVNMKAPDSDDYIEFMLYSELPDPAKRGSQHHICLFVPDMDKALATLDARKGSYSRPMEIRTGINRKRQLNLFDPDGTRVELMEPFTVDGKPTPSATAPPPIP